MNYQHTNSFIHPKMPQLSDFQRAVIILLKTENPTSGLNRCAEILPNFFREITPHQFSAVAALLQLMDLLLLERVSQVLELLHVLTIPLMKPYWISPCFLSTKIDDTVFNVYLENSGFQNGLYIT